jgi:hypothetical protein
MLEEPFLRTVVCRAGQAGQVDENGHLLRRILECLRRQVQVEPHLAVGGGRMMGELEQTASEGGDARFCRYGHACLFSGIDLSDRETNSMGNIVTELWKIGWIDDNDNTQQTIGNGIFVCCGPVFQFN